MNAIISIKPVYVRQIISRQKLVEFRKQVFKRHVDRCYIYSSSPQKQICAYFTVKECIIDTPANLWELYKNMGGITENDFFKYYQNNNTGVALVFDKVVILPCPVDPFKTIPGFVPPQSFRYLEYNL